MLSKLKRPLIVEGTHSKAGFCLVSYLKSPLQIDRADYFRHTNYDEARLWVDALCKRGYTCIVYNFSDYPIWGRRNSLDVAVGFGKPFNRAECAQKIFYGTGHHPLMVEAKTNSLRISLMSRYGLVFGGSGGYRVPTDDIKVSALVASDIICLGNRHVGDSYRKMGQTRVHEITPFPLTGFTKDENVDVRDLSSDNTRAGKDILWFGSYGALHKGIQDCISLASSQPNTKVHICGRLSREEKDLVLLLGSEMDVKVLLHGEVDAFSEAARSIYRQCACVCLPSMSEGGSPGLLTVVKASGLYPIFTREVGIELPVSYSFDWSVDNHTELVRGYEKALASQERQHDTALANVRHINTIYTRSRFSLDLGAALDSVIKANPE